jgi:hypothetical protein
MSKVAVVAHARKSFGGLPDLRRVLARAVSDLCIKVHPCSVTICVPA